MTRLTTICERLPEVSVQRKGRHAQFSVRGRTFVYFLDDHHGDGIVSLCWKTERGENAKWAALDPERFYLPAYIGSRGWAALRLDRGRVNWKEVEDFVRDSYRLIAPKSLRG